MTAVTWCGSNTGGQQAWDPDQYVQFNRLTNKYEVDQQLIDDVTLDGLVLFQQDQARLVEQSSGYYKFESIHSDDLAAHLGFKNDDIVREVNGYDLQTWNDYAQAIVDLAGVSPILIEIERNGAVTTLTYKLN